MRLLLAKLMLFIGISLAWESPAFCASILLLRDGPAWYSPPEDANVDELTARGLSFDFATSGAVGALDLTPYDLIIVESGQSQTFYGNLFGDGADGPLLANIDAWVAAGGVLSFGGADSASGAFGGGVWRGTLPGGVTKAFGSDSDDTGIADPNHPIVTGAFGGSNGGPLLDAGCYTDLDCWDFSSFGDFENLPPGATIVLKTATGFPVLVEYSYGLGTVIAATTTTEAMYNGGFGNVPVNRKLLANELGYQLHLAGVPEPSALLLLGVAAVTMMRRIGGLGGPRRRWNSTGLEQAGVPLSCDVRRSRRATTRT